MIELRLTKAKLTEYLRVFRLVLGICDSFTITNDIIQPVEITNEIITGAHRIKHPLFPVTFGHVFQSTDNIAEILNCIRDKKGVKEISIINDTNILAIRLDYEEYILAVSTERTDSTRTFEDIVNQYVLTGDKTAYSPELLAKARSGEVITIGDNKYGYVRLSKSSFPLMGVSRSAEDVNFSGQYALGVYNADLVEHYIASYIQYKYCEAFHMYIYIPFMSQ